MLASQVVQGQRLTPARMDSWAKQFPRGTGGDRVQLWRKRIQPWGGEGGGLLPPGPPARQTMRGMEGLQRETWLPWQEDRGCESILQGKGRKDMNVYLQEGETQQPWYRADCVHDMNTCTHLHIHTGT